MIEKSPDRFLESTGHDQIALEQSTETLNCSPGGVTGTAHYTGQIYAEDEFLGV